jgi:hypothetical protein
MQIGVRATAIFGIVVILVGGIVSACRHEEIYVICPIAWCMGAAHLIQSLGLAAPWGFGFLLVGACLLVALYGFLGAMIVSIAVVFLPRSRILLQIGSLSYGVLAFAMGSPLYLIFTVDYLGSLFKNASGPPLSEAYSILPALFLATGLLLYIFSRMLRTTPSL